MKKLIIALVFILCLYISGCQSQESDYNEATNQSIYFHGIHFQIPENWEKEMEEKNYLGYTGKSKNGDDENYLSICFEPNTNTSAMFAALKSSLKFLEEKGLEIKCFEHADTEINHMSVKKVTYRQKDGSDMSEIQVVFLQIEEGVIEFTFYAQREEDYKEFEEVIKSIK